MNQKEKQTDIIYQPGQEPEKIKKRMVTLFAKLDIAYPNKVIVGLSKDHKKWAQTVTELYRLLGYPNGNAFLEAYGYSVQKGSLGRAAKHMETIDELKRRYTDGPVYSSIKELKEANQDLASKFKNLANQAPKLFGMKLSDYLIQEGILAGEISEEVDEKAVFKELKSRLSSPYEGTYKEMTEEYSDINWNAIKKVYKNSGSDNTYVGFLAENGIIAADTRTAEEKISDVVEELKKRYSDREPEETIKDLAENNSDLPILMLNTWVKNAYQISTKQYLIRQGLLKEEKELTSDSDFAKEESKAELEIERIETDGFIIENGVLVEYTGRERTVTIPNMVTKIKDHVFSENISLRKVIMPNTVNKLGWWIFQNCKNLSDVVLSENLSEIPCNTFEGTALKKIIIPKNVRQIDGTAFCECKKLTEVIILSDNVNIDIQAFTNSPNVKIYCKDYLRDDLHRVTQLPCYPLDANQDDNRRSIYYYDDVTIMESFCEAKEEIDKAKTFKVNISNTDFKVRLKPESSLIEILDIMCQKVYSFAEAEKNYVTREESLEQFYRDDPNARSDGFMYVEPSILPEAKPIPADELSIRINFLKKVYRALNDKEIMEKLVNAVPKKKNGTFKINEYTRIASAGIVESDCSIPEIVAKPKNDTTLEVFAKKMAFSAEEIQRLRESFFISAFGENSSLTAVPVEETEHQKTEYITGTVNITLNGIVLPVTMIKENSGKLVIDAKHRRELDSFKYIKPINDNEYKFCIPELYTEFDSNGIQVKARFDGFGFERQWDFLLMVMEYANAPIKDEDTLNNLKERHESYCHSCNTAEMNNIIANPNYIQMCVFALLRSLEYIEEKFTDYAMEAESLAKRKKDGSLSVFGARRIYYDLMQEMELFNYGFNSVVSSKIEKNNTVVIEYL